MYLAQHELESFYCYQYYSYTLVNHDALSFDDTLHTFASHLQSTLFVSVEILSWCASVKIAFGNVLQGLPFQCTSCYSPVIAHEDDSPAPLHQLLTHSCFSQALLTPAAMWLRPLQTAAR